MHNNDILRRLRYNFDFSDAEMIQLFKLAEVDVDRTQISNWLKKDEDPEFDSIYDKDLAIFLNGFINLKRGKKEGEQAKPEKSLNNNIIFRKLKIALNLRDEDILEIFKLVDFRISKHELSDFFRKPDHKHYRPCKDQFLRNFLYGMQVKYRKNANSSQS
mgnify:CR=1 FL=1